MNKKALYESIMKDVAVVVKRRINESTSDDTKDTDKKYDDEHFKTSVKKLEKVLKCKKVEHKSDSLVKFLLKTPVRIKMSDDSTLTVTEISLLKVMIKYGKARLSFGADLVYKMKNDSLYDGTKKLKNFVEDEKSVKFVLSVVKCVNPETELDVEDLIVE